MAQIPLFNFGRTPRPQIPDMPKQVSGVGEGLEYLGLAVDFVGKVVREQEDTESLIKGKELIGDANIALAKMEETVAAAPGSEKLRVRQEELDRIETELGTSAGKLGGRGRDLFHARFAELKSENLAGSIKRDVVFGIEEHKARGLKALEAQAEFAITAPEAMLPNHMTRMLTDLNDLGVRRIISPEEYENAKTKLVDKIKVGRYKEQVLADPYKGWAMANTAKDLTQDQQIELQRFARSEMDRQFSLRRQAREDEKYYKDQVSDDIESKLSIQAVTSPAAAQRALRDPDILARLDPAARRRLESDITFYSLEGSGARVSDFDTYSTLEADIHLAQNDEELRIVRDKIAVSFGAEKRLTRGDARALSTQIVQKGDALRKEGITARTQAEKDAGAMLDDLFRADGMMSAVITDTGVRATVRRVYLARLKANPSRPPGEVALEVAKEHAESIQRDTYRNIRKGIPVKDEDELLEKVANGEIRQEDADFYLQLIRLKRITGVDSTPGPKPQATPKSKRLP